MPLSSETAIKFQSSERAKAYVKLFDHWRDGWIPEHGWLMFFTIVTFALGNIFVLGGIATILFLMLSGRLDEGSSFATIAIGPIFVSLLAALPFQIRWQRVRDKKRLVRIATETGQHFSTIDDARVFALSALFGRDPSQFTELANKLHSHMEREALYGVRSNRLFTWFLFKIADPDGKQRVLNLLLALIATTVAVMLKLNISPDVVFDAVSSGGTRLISSFLLATFLVWAYWLMLSAGGEALYRLAERLDHSIDARGFLRPVIADLLKFDASLPREPNWPSRQATLNLKPATQPIPSSITTNEPETILATPQSG